MTGSPAAGGARPAQRELVRVDPAARVTGKGFRLSLVHPLFHTKFD
jgi:hypothetical protein